MKIGVIGCGIVGEATAQMLEARGHTVGRHDPDKGLVDDGPFDVAFICVPTPGNEYIQRLDRAAVWGVAAKNVPRIAVIRSTLDITACTALQINFPLQKVVYMPCFVREAYANDEERLVQHRIYGATDKKAALVVAELIGDPYTMTDFNTAEFIKLALNAKLASDISFATEMSAAAAEFGVKWETVAETLKKDRRIGVDAYLRPGPFGGKCLPKDTANLMTQTHSRFLRAVLEINDERNRDAQQLQEEYVHAASG